MILRQVYAGYFGMVSQGIDNQLDVRRGGCGLSSRGHENTGNWLFSFSRSFVRKRGIERRRRRIESTDDVDGARLWRPHEARLRQELVAGDLPRGSCTEVVSQTHRCSLV